MILRDRYWREVRYYYNHSTRLTILPLSERKPRLACSGCNGKLHRYIHKKIGVTLRYSYLSLTRNIFITRIHTSTLMNELEFKLGNRKGSQSITRPFRHFFFFFLFFPIHIYMLLILATFPVSYLNLII